MKKTLCIVCIIPAILFLYNAGSRDFWAPDEGDFAQIVKELDGNFIVPHLNGKPYGEKPPLFYYLNYLSAKVFSPLTDEASMRIPTALSALLLVILLFCFAGRAFGKKEALFAALILISSPLYYWQARYLQVDMVFAAFVASSLLCFFRSYHQGGKTPYIFFYVLAALAFMTKGPLAVILIFPVVLIYGWSQRDLRIFRSRETAIGLCIFLLIILPWYLAVYIKEGFPYLQENIIRQNITRFFDAWSHKRPFYYYFTTLPLDFFPWSLFLPMGLYLAAKGWTNDHRMRFFLVWFLWMFLFFSLSSGKISKYMIPLLPAMALMTARAFTTEDGKYVFCASALLATLFLALGIILMAVRTEMYKEFHPERILVGILSILVSIAIAWSALLKRKDAIACFLFVFLSTTYMAANIWIYGKLNYYKSPRPFCEKVRHYLQKDGRWVYYGSMRGVYVYYIGRQAVHVGEHKVEELRQLQQRLNEFYLVTRKRDVGEVQGALANVDIVLQEKIGGTDMVLARYQGRGN
ncbi:MAG: glycosyltransferase family 39 protein [Syntrophorhabdaceae bacterium]|nr:glycosyltransferase family 39 protein [Syntrophorhabdaceae bacterium]